MQRLLWLVIALLLVQCSTAPNTGFLDRSVTLGEKTYRYQVYLPPDYSPSQKVPVVVELHGNKLQGSDGLLQTSRGLAEQIRLHRSRFPAIVVFPQCEVGKRWLYADMQKLAITVLDKTMAEFQGDPDRVYLVGFSMGATASYRIAYHWQNRFAAILAVAGRVETFDAHTYAEQDKQADRAANPFVTTADPFATLAHQIGHIPIWIVHGDADQTVPVEQSRQLVAALKEVKAAVHYQEYPDVTCRGSGESLC